MGKLIFADSFSNYTSKFPNWNSESDSTYRSVVFTSDGYLATHGKQFALTLVGDDVSGQLKIALNDAKTGITLTGNGITSSTALLPVYSVLGVDGNPVTVTGDGEKTIQHALASGSTDGTTTYGLTNKYLLTVPTLYVDAYGHVAKAVNGTSTYVNQVAQRANNDAKSYSLLFTSTEADTDAAETLYNANVTINPSTGTLSAKGFYEDGKYLSLKYLALSRIGDGTGTSITATAGALGVVKLSDSYTDTESLKAANGVAATPYAVSSALEAANTYAKDLFASNDAMVFMGTIKPDGTIVSHNSTVATYYGLSITNGSTKISALNKFNAGWTLKFTEAGEFTLGSTTQTVEVGDMLVFTSDGTTASSVSWSIIQTNIEDAVLASGGSLAKGLVISDGTGKTVTTFAYGDAGKALMSTGSGLQWADVVNNWRPVQVNGALILSNATDSGVLNIANGTGISITNTNGTVTITNSSPLSAATDLIFKADGTDIALYNPKNATGNPSLNFTDIIQATLNEGVISIAHKTSGVTASTTKGLYKFSVDKYGHITGTEAVSSTDLPASQYALTITGGSKSTTYNNSAAAGLTFVNGTDITWSSTLSNGVLSVTPSVTHKYKTISIQNSTDTSAKTTDKNTTTGIVFKAGDANTSFSMTDNVITLTTANTWRAVSAYTIGTNATSMTLNSINTSPLKFGDEFVYEDEEIKLVWTEISGDTITYKV